MPTGRDAEIIADTMPDCFCELHTNPACPWVGHWCAKPSTHPVGCHCVDPIAWTPLPGVEQHCGHDEAWYQVEGSATIDLLLQAGRITYPCIVRAAFGLNLDEMVVVAQRELRRAVETAIGKSPIGCAGIMKCK